MKTLQGDLRTQERHCQFYRIGTLLFHSNLLTLSLLLFHKLPRAFLNNDLNSIFPRCKKKIHI